MSHLRLHHALLVLVAGCAGKGEPLFPDLGDGKADVVDRVDLRGALEYGVPVDGEVTEDLEFHGYTLVARAGAVVTIEVTQAGSSRSMDSTLFVYGPRRESGGFGTEAIAFDDDSGWGALSRLRDLELAAEGTYLVVAGTHDGRGRGRYRLKASCPSGDCAPAAGACHPVVADEVGICIADLVASAEAATVSPIDALEPCLDAEVIVRAYDAICAGSPQPFCDRPFEEFATAQAEACRWELDDGIYDRMCVFGMWHRDLFRLPWLHVTFQREIASDDGLDALSRDQLVAAVRSAGFEDVDTVVEALEVVDQNLVNRHEVWDASGRRAFTVYEFGAGDTSLGLYFARGTTDRWARIDDAFLVDCEARTGTEERICRDEADCAEGLTCLGVVPDIGRGRCVDVDRATPGEGATCSGEVTGDCPQGSGLVCAGLTREPEGVCLPAWTRGRFATTPEQDIPDDEPDGARAMLVAYGLAAVDTDVEVLARIQHQRPGDLRVTLVSPAGEEKLVFEGPADPDFLELHESIDFGGDTAVNGVWTLRVVDTAAGQTGRIESFELWLGSRAD